MSIDSLSGISASISYGSGQDGMSGQAGGGSAITDKESFGAAVVSATLDKMNTGASAASDMGQTYDFSKAVLSGEAANKGLVTDLNI